MSNKKRTFLIGDEWLYFKVYTGYKTADTILAETILPLACKLMQENKIDYWFFIRYSDPHFHLRIRFYLSKIENIAQVILEFNAIFEGYLRQNLVWKIQTDTYQREIERYGNNFIEQSEKLFYYDSEMICKTIAMPKVKQDENMRWLLGLKMIDALLADFGFTLQNKLNLMNFLQNNFGKEFGITTEFRRQFGQKYRAEKIRIEQILDKSNEGDGEYSEHFLAIFERTEASKNLISEMVILDDLPLNDLLTSYIHMMINRLFRTQPRLHELVLYDYLYRYYKSLQIRDGGNNNKLEK